MLSRNNIKNIKALHLKKNRFEEQLFIAEGVKLIVDLLDSGVTLTALYYSNSQGLESSLVKLNNSISHQIDEQEMAAITLLANPSPALAVFRIPKYQMDYNQLNSGFSIFLDDIRDPGNLGTIIRMADWFGIEHVFCSPKCVEFFNPKVVQSTMGSIGRVNLHTFELVQLIDLLRTKGVEIPILGTVLNGMDLFTSEFPNHGIIVIGNESKGVSESIVPFFSHKIKIPRSSMSNAESLNAAVAASIVVSELFRKSSN